MPAMFFRLISIRGQARSYKSQTCRQRPTQISSLAFAGSAERGLGGRHLVAIIDKGHR